jgi:hypothetical protein
MRKGSTKTRIPSVVWVMTFLSFCVVLVVSCQTVDPRRVDVELEESAPVVKVTSYSGALRDLGLMTEIYGTRILKIQSEDIADNTGASKATGGEIQRNITEILKSTLNSIGGNLIFIEYNPAFIQNQIVTGYSNFEEKLIPDVVVTGGITEFDRGLETRGKGTDVGAEAEFTGVADWFPSKQVSVDYGQSSKAGKARITLDFNLKDFKTLAGIARMNTVNSMEVHKAVKQKEVGITLFGPTFGAKGSVKKVQGRHEAVRLLVQVSMIQMAGKYLALPYWRLLGEDTLPDEVVLDQLARDFALMNESQRVARVQELLFLHGCDVSPNGVLDDQTKKALQLCDSTLKPGSIKIDRDTFVNLYLSIPITDHALARRHQFASLTGGRKAVVAGSAVAPSEIGDLTRAPTDEQAERPVSRKEKGSVGRMLSDDEW